MSTAKAPRRVLLAEDEAIIRLDLREMLEEEGYEVVAEAGDGHSAVRFTDELRPDVVVMDIKMPGLDGSRRLRGSRAGGSRRSLVLTAFGQRELVERAGKAGAMGYLVKPFQKGAVVPAIELALGPAPGHGDAEREVEDLTERLKTRTLVDRARGVLMDRYGMAEADAFRFLQKTAMDRRPRMREVARRVVDGEMEV